MGNRKDLVVIRPIVKASIYAKCPFCNTERYLDRSGSFHEQVKFKCEGCGALFLEYLSGIQTVKKLLDNDDYREDDVTVKLSEEKPTTTSLVLQQQVSPTLKAKIEKTAFYFALVTCPFCLQECITRNNSPQPHLAQWCPNQECASELVTTIWAETHVGGDMSGWYHITEDPEKLENPFEGV